LILLDQASILRALELSAQRRYHVSMKSWFFSRFIFEQGCQLQAAQSMNFAAKAYRRMLYKMVGIQGILVSILVVCSYMKWGTEYSAGLFYGGAVTVVTTLYSGWRFKLDTERVDNPPSVMMAGLYKGTLLRFLMVIALLLLGLRYFQLDPEAVILGFVVAQAGYFLGPLAARWGRQ